MAEPLLKNKWGETWISVMLVLLFTGLLVSRALVSFASVLMVVPFFFGKRKITEHRTSFIALLLILLPVILSGLWSENSGLWWNSVTVKLPLLTMFLGLVSVKLSSRTKTTLVYIYLVLISLGCAWSLSRYFVDTAAIQQTYLKAKTIPVPADDDHIRFSWMTVVAIILGTDCYLKERGKQLSTAILVILIFLIVYLHLLAAKTGLVCLYAGVFAYLFHTFFVQKKWKRGLVILVTGFAAVVICYLTLPTLRNRVQYVVYDYSHYSRGNLLPGYNDASRLLSMKAGYQLTLQHPLQGVGFGDLHTEVDAWHQVNHPSSLAYERFLPANEWLVYGTGSGIPGLICFTIGFFLLLYATGSYPIFSLILSVTALLPFLFDDTLEGQTGVIVLAFIAFFGQQKLAETTVHK